jgi:lipopolysaccharide biosynthesis glycosyltransferase
MINTLYCGNKKVFGDTFVSVASLCDNASEPVNIIHLTIHIPDIEPKGKPLTVEHEKVLDALVKSKNPLNSYRVIDVTEQFREKLTSGKNLYTVYTPYTNIRLVVDKVPQIPDKIIYLDNDTMVYGDIKEMWDYDLTDYEVGVIKDNFIIKNKIIPWSTYFNAGVMMLNMERIRQGDFYARAIDLVQNKKMMFPDQTALNIVFKKHKRILPSKFNAKDWSPKVVIHHFCLVRQGRIPLIGKWWHRIKPSETELLRQRLPAYNKYFDMLDEQKEKTPDLFDNSKGSHKVKKQK